MKEFILITLGRAAMFVVIVAGVVLTAWAGAGFGMAMTRFAIKQGWLP